MNIDYKTSFLKDLKKIDSKSIKLKVKNSIENIENSKNLQDINNIKKMQGKNNKDFYRIKIDNYRIGIKIENDLVIFVRIKHRRDIYKYFP
ncbi:MAG TPA: type II toxin-antitoxin system mRNA interferase toxin, RelE/StbE family [Spirochaetota bacterium]|jgi:mRNA interferase RelE/StbE|nr:MAG: Plasmid stabilization system protein [Spirochaetes bacterium ADurb.Bin133]HNZ27049.1 type II toxin-antitoxin system mRNA interferase toxin, RelE/StbE family [Spirochaetota bacterium]HOF01279.1 type II toxin-antitoxin system mRNA interferase toxin, RelE/StbE family [Spirochaetota bacterium]HOS33773.1 type II toxin-antitoxin system mRNA interferase toxin, RelE/StbE family [Spirochaetota bacterium]HOS56266.1 type II toxin-antitoxin system mRNA interferase toxin, RelE/StbE family [Spirochae